MDIQMLTRFFMWCTIVDAGLLMFSFATCAFAGDWVYKMHTKWFPMQRETFNVVIYSLLGTFKVLVVVFNAVPLVALLTIG